ncbi:MAG: hypothetical protein LAT66_05095 [Alkalimonas sp.]|nr:hypothetical protein [Alkalimonas sp.]
MSLTGLANAAGFIAVPGMAQASYDDATMIFRFKDLLLLAMFDISTSRPLPKDILLTTFMASVDDAIARGDLSTEPGALQSMLQRFVVRLNAKLYDGCVSIAVVFIDAHSVWGYCAGDVRMGCLKDGVLDWFTPVHTVANIFSPFTDDLKSSPNRHTLTRYLRPHRPFEPEYFEFHLPENSQFLCATDGFWCDPLWGKAQSLCTIPSVVPTDDCTCLWFNAKTFVASAGASLTCEDLLFVTRYETLDIRSPS